MAVGFWKFLEFFFSNISLRLIESTDTEPVDMEGLLYHFCYDLQVTYL